jgi:hypothetical protein
MAQTITRTIPNLIQGVSQRAPATRDPSQAEEQLNGYSSLSMGLRKRPGAQLLAEISATDMGEVFSHAILRDQQERYLAFISKTGAKVYSLTGVAQTVNNTAAAIAYVSQATSVITDLRASSIADYTFISCTKVKPAMKADTFATGSRNPAHEALIWVKQAAYGELYEVTINGTKIAVQAPAAPVIEEAGNLISNPINASTIAALIDTEAEALSGIESSRNGAVIWIRSSTQITIKVPEALEGNLAVITSRVDNYVQLPATAPAGYLVEVVGSATTQFDNYFLKFEHDPGTQVVDTIGRGFWKEIPAPGIKYLVDPATMPMALVRLANGTFYFGPLDGSTQSGTALKAWGNRGAGDETTAPTPAFIGNAINDIFVWRNRMGMLAGERVILSRTGKFFDFFPATATQVRADDPIELAAAGTKVSVLRHAMPFQDQIVLFSDQTQFRLAAAGGSVLTPASAEITVLTQYEADAKVRPVQMGDAITFVQPTDTWAQLREFRFTGSASTIQASATEITSQVGSYIPSDVARLTVDNASNLLAVLTRRAGYKNTVFVNKHFYGSNAEGNLVKVQNSWSRWTFPCEEVLDVLAVKEQLYLVTKCGTKVHLEVVDIRDQLTDDAQLPLLDRWVSTGTETLAPVRLPAGVYNANTDTTTWTLPYTLSSRGQVVTNPATSTLGGMKVLGEATSGNTITAEGNWSAEPVIAGQVFSFLYRFSEFRLSVDNQPTVPRSSIRVQLRKLLLNYHRSQYFVARVKNDGREPAEYTFGPQILDSRFSYLAPPPVDADLNPRFLDGVFPVPVMSRSDNSQIELENDSPLPCHFLSVDWQALVSGRGATRSLR